MNERQRKSVETLASMCHDTLLGKGVDLETFTSNLRLFADYMDATHEGGPVVTAQMKQIISERETRATHVCAVCEARWIDNSVFGDGETWSLASIECGKCCDNDRMDRPNIIKLPWYERLTS